VIKTHPVNLNRDPQLPTGIHDPRWKEPAVATRVALTTFQRLMMNPALFPAAVMLPAGDVNPGFKGNVDKRAFTFQPAQDIPLKKLRFKGGSYGEIHHRYSFGGRLPAVNFHAQAVIFGLDSSGRFFLSATVGRMDGGWGNSAALVVKMGEAGAIQWTHEMDPPQDHPVLVTGQDAALSAAFDGVNDAHVAFHTLHAGR